MGCVICSFTPRGFLRLRRCSDAPALGCAVLAAVAAGLYPDIRVAAAAMVSVDKVIEPDPQRHQLYQEILQRYKALYPALRPGFHALLESPSSASSVAAETGRSKRRCSLTALSRIPFLFQ